MGPTHLDAGAASMKRFVTPRSISLAVLAVVLMASMVVLGLWQLGVYDEQQRDDSAAQVRRDPVPVDEVLGPDAAFTSEAVGRPVTVTGRWLGAEQIYVSKLPGQTKAYAVVTPMVTDSDSVLLVVRGSATQPRADAPTGHATLTGVLEPPTERGAGLDERRVTGGIRVAALVDGFSKDLYGGYVIASAGPETTGLAQIDPQLPDASRWAGIRNLLYAIQWWLFAAFVAFMWWRIVTDLDASDRSAGRVG